MVPIDKTRIIRKNLGKSYQPGTFGIEIEFRAEEQTDDDYYEEEEFDDWEARRAFRNEYDDIPESLDDWLRENEEPEKPDPEDYKYDKTDPLVNLYNLNMEKRANEQASSFGS